MSSLSRFCAGLFMALVAHSALAAAAAPHVVASIKPVHSIATAVMAGVGTPALLLKTGASPHAYAMKLSDAQLLNGADVVLWIGPAFETFLDKPLRALGRKARVISLAGAPGLRLLGGAGADLHIWLDPMNAVAMSHAIAAALSEADPANAERYQNNARVFEQDARALDTALEARLAPVKGRSYLMAHDAYRYFETRYGLSGVGSISVTPDRPPGARRLSEIRREINRRGVVCIFAEPPFEPKYMEMLIAETKAKSGVLDPEGISLAEGRDLYFQLMRGLADGLVGCLA